MASSVDAAQDLSVRECLVFAQIVHELGARDWTKISTVLSKHPLVTRPRGFYSAKTCQSIYRSMTEKMDLNFETPEVEAPKATPNLRLAQKYYTQRVAEICQLISEKETSFRRIMEEMEKIKRGEWDEQIADEFREESAPKTGGEDEPETIADETDILLDQPPSVSEVDAGVSEASKERSVSMAPDGSAETGDVVDLTFDDAPDGPHDEEIPALPTRSDGEPFDDTFMDPHLKKAPDQDFRMTPKKESRFEVTSVPTSPWEKTENLPADAETSISSLLPMTGTSEDVASEVQPEDPEVIIPVEADSAPAESSSPSDKKGKRKGTRSVEPQDRKRLRMSSEAPENTEASATITTTATGPRLSTSIARRPRGSVQSTENKRFQAVIGVLNNNVSSLKNGEIFAEPVTDAVAPDYTKVVKEPMDLKTIKQHIRQGVITTTSEYERAINLMFANAIMYNLPGSETYEMTRGMMIEAEKLIKEHRATETFRSA